MNKFIMMVGLPASGKSTYAKEISKKENAIIHSSDELRVELFGDINECDKNGELFQELYKRIREDLKANRNVILDSTNISHKRRIAVLNEFKKFNCTKECYFIATPYEKCIEQNNLRDRKVPFGVIKEMYKSFYIPQYYEGWDKINIIWNTEGYSFDTHELFNGQNGLNYIDQENPNHTLTIGKHCMKCSQLCEEQIDDFELNMAALYHDIGKRFTKQFKNAKGEKTDIAHYYQHHLVSAYDSMFYLKNLEEESLMQIVNYIQWHMQLFFLESEKSKTKFVNLVGQETYDKLLILHESDKLAK
jgi:predicted kinase